MKSGVVLILLIPATLAAQSAPCAVDAAAARTALVTAADSTAPVASRVAAIRVLRYARWKPAIPTLVRLAEPLRGEWVIWQSALHALTEYPYVELQPFWRDLLAFPRRNVRNEALRGIALVGEPADLIQIRESTQKDHDPATRALVADAEAKLRLPIARRAPPPAPAACSGTPRSR